MRKALEMAKGKSVSQPMCPHGIVGRVFGKLMDLFNRPAHEFALKRLAVQENDAILEIGFGTGQLTRMLARKANKGFVAGVDPSELMVNTAHKRNTKYIKDGILDLRQGDASNLPWANSRFDKIAALHSFQFWSDPAHDLEEVARVLKPRGFLLLILRAHDGGRSWVDLPNPLSRSENEVESTIAELARHGFSNAAWEGKVGTSSIVTAVRTDGGCER